MKPVFQTRFGAPHGNCYAACLASILELPLDEVPQDFMVHDDWYDRVNAWLAPRGLTLLCFGWDVDTHTNLPFTSWHIMSGPSPRGDFQHAVVAREGKIVHDPHPEGGSLLGTKRELEFFVALDPSKVARSDRADAAKSGAS